MASHSIIEEIVEESKEKQPEVKLINGAVHARRERKLVLPSLNLDKIFAQYREADYDQPLYIIPLHIADDGRIDDVAGEVSTLGQAVISVFVVVTEDRIPEQFPSLVRFSKWKSMFKDAVADKPDLFEKAGLKKHVPVYLPEVPFYLAKIIADFCTTDIMLSNFGPIAKPGAKSSDSK